MPIRQVRLSELWEAFPDQTRDETLRVLSQVVVRQLLRSADRQEVSHEDD
ncbi:MAG: hypothetical protein ACE5KM_09230 [Planctomycetaceae bacterium]